MTPSKRRSLQLVGFLSIVVIGVFIFQKMFPYSSIQNGEILFGTNYHFQIYDLKKSDYGMHKVELKLETQDKKKSNTLGIFYTKSFKELKDEYALISDGGKKYLLLRSFNGKAISTYSYKVYEFLADDSVRLLTQPFRDQSLETPTPSCTHPKIKNGKLFIEYPSYSCEYYPFEKTRAVTVLLK